jgi:hypothetical protein
MHSMSRFFRLSTKVKRKEHMSNRRRALYYSLFTLVVSAFTFGEVAAQADGVSITFLANEGVLLSGGGRKVLIDALFLRYGAEYALPPDSTQRALQAARSPFELVDLILVTHRHGDHFHPEPVAAHLQANPRAHLVTSQQVIDSLRSDKSQPPNNQELTEVQRHGKVCDEQGLWGLPDQAAGAPGRAAPFI